MNPPGQIVLFPGQYASVYRSLAKHPLIPERSEATISWLNHSYRSSMVRSLFYSLYFVRVVGFSWLFLNNSGPDEFRIIDGRIERVEEVSTIRNAGIVAYPARRASSVALATWLVG